MEDPLLQHHKNIFYLKIRIYSFETVKIARKKFKLKKLCLSGGVALNCSLNGRS